VNFYFTCHHRHHHEIVYNFLIMGEWERWDWKGRKIASEGGKLNLTHSMSSYLLSDDFYVNKFAKILKSDYSLIHLWINNCSWSNWSDNKASIKIKMIMLCRVVSTHCTVKRGGSVRLKNFCISFRIATIKFLNLLYEEITLVHRSAKTWNLSRTHLWSTTFLSPHL
jgi:hypothetical protein